MEKNKTIRFNYDEDTMGNHKMFIWVGGSVLFISYLICAYFWGFNAPAFPYTFLSVYLVYLWSRRWEGKNEETEKKIALALMKGHIKEDVCKLYGHNVSIASIGYYFFRGDNEGRRQCILVYLSNDKTILYNVRHIPNGEDDVCSCEIDLKATETEERKMVRIINPHFRPLLYLTPASDMKVRILLIYIIGIVALGAVLVSMYYYKWVPLTCLLGYMVVMGLLAYWGHIAKWGGMSRFFMKRLSRVMLILNYMVPAGSLAIVLFFSSCIAFGIPCGVLYFFEQYTDVKLEKSVQVFICLVMSCIILVHFDRWIRKYILRLLFKDDSGRGLQKHPFVEVALNLTQGRNINFLIYLLYFLFLTWTTLTRLQGWDPLINQEFIDGATPAFLVHIAYTNMAFRLHDVDLKMDTMIKFMMKAYDIRVLQFKQNDNGKDEKEKN